MSIEATLARVAAIRQALADPATVVGSGGVASGGTEAPSTPATGAGTSFASALQQASGGYEGSAEGASGTGLPEPAGAGSGLGASAGLATPSGLSAASSLPTSSGLDSAASLGVYQPQGIADLSGSAALTSVDGAGEGSPGARIVAIAESQLGQTEQPPGSNESPAIAQYREATAGAVRGAPWCAYFASWVARQAGEPIGAAGQGAGDVSDVWSWAQSTGRAIPNGPGVVPQPGDLIVFGDEHVGIVRDVLPNGQIQTIEGNYENKVAANVRSPSEATGYVNMS
jgi:hypothetical protein